MVLTPPGYPSWDRPGPYSHFSLDPKLTPQEYKTKLSKILKRFENIQIEVTPNKWGYSGVIPGTSEQQDYEFIVEFWNYQGRLIIEFRGLSGERFTLLAIRRKISELIHKLEDKSNSKFQLVHLDPGFNPLLAPPSFGKL